MLAFAFRTFSVEADLAKGLLLLPTDSEDSPNDDATGHKNDTTSNKTNAGMDDGDENDETLYSNYDTGNVEKAISARDMLAIVMSGLARPLKSRILHVVSSLTRRPDNSHDDDDIDNNDHEGTADFENLEEQGALVRTRVSQLYDICGLILFYVSTMEKSLLKLQQQQQTEQEVEENETNPLIQCLLESLTEASKGYEATIRGYSAMLEPLSIVSGMSEAHWVQQMLRLLSQVRLASPGFSLDIACPDEECQRILSLEWVTETLVESCWTKCTTIDTVVELKQGVLASKQAGMMMMQGSGSAVAEKLDAMMDEREASLIQELVRVETGMALEQCGLGNLVDAWKQWQIAEVNNQTKIAMYPRLSFHEVQAGIKEFYGSLYSPPLPSLEGTIQDPLARQSVRSQIAASVCTAYAGLYHSMAAAGSGYPDTLFLVHKPEEVVTLFSV